jgi:hypothetical protein
MCIYIQVWKNKCILLTKVMVKRLILYRIWEIPGSILAQGPAVPTEVFCDPSRQVPGWYFKIIP